LAANTEAGNRAAQKKVIDIGVLSEDELLSKLRGYINSMCAFARSTRNVHKELKETLANSNKVMAQYVKVLRQGRNIASTSKEYKSAHTQTPEYAQTGLAKDKIVSGTPAADDSSPDRPSGELPACIEVIRDMMAAQGDVVGKLAVQVEKIHQQQQQSQQQKKKSKTPRQQVQQEQPTLPPERQTTSPKNKRRKRRKRLQTQTDEQQAPEQVQEQEDDQEQPQPQLQPSWSQVVGRSRKANKVSPPSPPPRSQPSAAEKIALLRRRVPKTAAVTIDRPGDGCSLAAHR